MSLTSFNHVEITELDVKILVGMGQNQVHKYKRAYLTGKHEMKYKAIILKTIVTDFFLPFP